MFQLKEYQKKTLDVLQGYLEQVKFFGAQGAFQKIHPLCGYNRIETLEEVPYVCLRLPTGGGKTYLATHSISVAANAYLEKEYPVVLWFVPTTTIKTQTIETLKNPLHPNREVLENAFGGNVAVFDIEDYINVRPQDLENKCCIFVSTFQTFRVNETTARRIYAHNEALEPHFAKVSRHADLERMENGKIKFSFANLLNVHRPLVIADEAHNNSTNLGYEVLKRVNPACIIEYTATPARNSNVLHNVVAMELKVEEMIKLPIILTIHQSWEQSLSAAILARKGLAGLAEKDEKYIRPIMLIQAESKDKNNDDRVTVEVVKKYLIENENIESEKIAVATGEQRELDGINVFDPSCPIEYIITVEALKEGWDCSFAYCFCSVAQRHSAKDIEQLLGRVLRMPYAKSRKQDELNKAYAFVSSSSWTDGVAQLKDRLVDMGFEEQEIPQSIQTFMPEVLGAAQDVQKPTITLNVSDFKLEDFTKEEQEKITITETPIGKTVTINSVEPISEEFETKIINAAPVKERKSVEITVKVGLQNQIVYTRKTPSQQGEHFIVPQLSLFVDGDFTSDYDEYFLDPTGRWLLDYPAKFTPAEFRLTKEGTTVEIDLHGTKIEDRYLQQTFALDLTDTQTDWTIPKLAIWITRQIPSLEIKQEIQLSFTRQLIENLAVVDSYSFNDLLRTKFILKEAIRDKIKEYKEKALNSGIRKTLFAPDANVKTDFNFSIDFAGKQYIPTTVDCGTRFNKHFFPDVHPMNSEERECARAIDNLQETKYWIRNIEKHAYSFFIPMASGRFYPDFLVQLNDGRILVIEYKGEHLLTNDDTKEKEAIGQLWEKASGGKCLFLLAVDKDAKGRGVFEQIRDKIKG
ncbi:MAG: DEAD/DEAH box helicase family protein [Heliobacteriaceae bacterium]|jgi:type III restriction enzyme|nr:DEAD/DEAH box helicase family protein [Heliobacteriaceae bacterium]